MKGLQTPSKKQIPKWDFKNTIIFCLPQTYFKDTNRLKINYIKRNLK